MRAGVFCACAIVRFMHQSSVWALGWRNLWRDVRAGELRLLVVAVLLAVAALTSVGFFADRLQAGLQRDARQLLGGDVVVVSDNPAPPEFVEQAKAEARARAEAREKAKAQAKKDAAAKAKKKAEAKAGAGASKSAASKKKADADRNGESA